jgi:hypothetical protein
MIKKRTLFKIKLNGFDGGIILNKVRFLIIRLNIYFQQTLIKHHPFPYNLKKACAGWKKPF